MKLVIINISDVHADNSIHNSQERAKKIAESLRIHPNVDKCIIAISGDLTQNAALEQFEVIRRFISSLIREIKKIITSIRYIDVIAVPGNHDIDQSRNTLTREIIASAVGKVDAEKLVEVEIEKLNNFYSYSMNNQCFKYNKLIDVKIIKFEKYRVRFNLINTAVFSLLKDEKGIHYLPDSALDLITTDEEADFSVTIMHHSPTWFIASLMNELERKIYSSSSLIFVGHEHDNSSSSIKKEHYDSIELISGGLFNDNKDPNRSEFYTIVIDFESKSYDVIFNNWDKERRFYNHSYIKKQVKITKNKALQPKREFISKIEIDDKQLVVSNFLSYYTYPSLIVTSEENEKKYNLDNEKELLNCIKKEKKILIQSKYEHGKTTLLKRIYLELLKDDYLPIFLNRDSLSGNNVDRVIKNAFEDQFSESNTDYNKFQQQSKSKKILLVDDIDLLKSHSVEQFLNKVDELFDIIVVTCKDLVSFDVIKSAKEKINIFEKFMTIKIDKFYNTKRKELINNVCTVYLPNMRDKESFTNDLNRFISQQIRLFELTPLFVIQLTKYSLENEENPKDTKIFGKVFEANLIKSIEKNVEKGKTDETISIIKRIAYYIHSNKVYPFNRNIISQIINEYNIDYGYEVDSMKFIEVLKNARIITESACDNFRFSSNSYYAFFVASELIRRHNRESDIDGIKAVLKNICFGINSDIILFLSYIADNVNILYSVYDEAMSYLSDWVEFDFSSKQLLGIKKLNHDLEIDLIKMPDQSEINEKQDEHEKNVDDHEKNTCINTELEFEMEDLYSYSEEDADTFLNSLIKATNFAQTVAKILPNFGHELKVKEKQLFVKSIYSFPNKILFKWLSEINLNYDEIIDEIIVMIESSKLVEKSKYRNYNAKKEFAQFLLLDIVSAIIPSLYDRIADISVSNNTYKLLNDFNCETSLAYKLLNIQINSNFRNYDEFAKKLVLLSRESNSPLFNLVVKKIGRKHILYNNDKNHSNRQKINDHIFPKRERKQLIIEQFKKSNKDRTIKKLKRNM